MDCQVREQKAMIKNKMGQRLCLMKGMIIITLLLLKINLTKAQEQTAVKRTKAKL